MAFEDISQRHLGGLFIQVLDSVPVVLMAKNAGFDFLFFDEEHGDIDQSHLSELMLFGNSIGIPSLVRAPQLSRVNVSHILDLGAAGVMVPMLESREQALKLVEWAKYSPTGKRSYSGGAHTFYSSKKSHAENMINANAKVLAIAQVETVLGVQNISDIVSVPGIDAVVIGPSDLAISMGRPNEIGCEEELALIDKVRDACVSAHKAFGIIGSNDLIEKNISSVNLMISALDVHLLRSIFASAVDNYAKLKAQVNETKLE
jgi:2-keto-3-deoxy-L-rhamnonate aldolase RhmA